MLRHAVPNNDQEYIDGLSLMSSGLDDDSPWRTRLLVPEVSWRILLEQITHVQGQHHCASQGGPTIRLFIYSGLDPDLVKRTGLLPQLTKRVEDGRMPRFTGGVTADKTRLGAKSLV